LSQLSSGAVSSVDATQDLNSMSASPLQVDVDSDTHHKSFSEFLELQTISSLGGLLRDAGFEGNCRQLILGLGLLLQPVMASGSNRLEKSLCLPLPIDPMAQWQVAAFWLALINPFLQRADFELSLFVAKSQQRPVLVVGFSGASSLTLEALLNPKVAQEHFIGFDLADWVEEAVLSDYGVAKVSSYLEQPRLSLASARQYFNEVFLGV
jgi:type VI secretion system protein ImpM